MAEYVVFGQLMRKKRVENDNTNGRFFLHRCWIPTWLDLDKLGALIGLVDLKGTEVLKRFFSSSVALYDVPIFADQ